MKAAGIVALTVFMLLFGTCAYADDCGGGWRYADNLDGTITDCRTGLIWLKDANCTDGLGIIDKSSGDLNWYDAKKWAAALNQGHCGLTDGSFPGFWRLPTITEWMAMIAGAKSKGFTNPILTDWTGAAKWTDGNPFYNVQSTDCWYWSSDLNPYMPGEGFRWIISLYSGVLGGGSASALGAYVWPVRAGQVGGNNASFGTVTVE